MNAASPGVIIAVPAKRPLSRPRAAYLDALADANDTPEYRTILEAGLDLQLDCPHLALSRHMLLPI